MKELYVLYILRVSKLRSIKIGLTSHDRKETRFKEIEKAFGKIDISKSFYYTSTSMKDIKNLEKALHLILWRDSKELCFKASGHTEFFKESKLEYVESFLKEVKSSGANKIYGPYLLNGTKKSSLSFFFLLIFFSISGTSMYFFEYINGLLHLLIS